MLGLISGLSSTPLISVRLSLRLTHCLHSCSFIVSFRPGKCESSNFALLSQDCFASSGSLTLPSEFQDEFVNFYKEASWGFDRDLGRICRSVWRVLPS